MDREEGDVELALEIVPLVCLFRFPACVPLSAPFLLFSVFSGRNNRSVSMTANIQSREEEEEEDGGGKPAASYVRTYGTCPVPGEREVSEVCSAGQGSGGDAICFKPAERGQGQTGLSILLAGPCKPRSDPFPLLALLCFRCRAMPCRAVQPRA